MGQTRDNHIWYLEHLETGTLESWKGAIENTQMLQISHELVTALQHLHSQGVIHMDLHPRNVIIDVRGHCRIAHFDRAVHAGHQGPVPTYEGSAYTPPESRHPGNYEVNSAADIWGLGVLLSELVAGELTEEVILNAFERQHTLSDAAASREFTQLIDVRYLLRDDPRERLSAECALTTPYLEEAIAYAEYRQEPPFLRVARVPVMSGPIVGGPGQPHAY
ncbi:kinase-like protein, partial [Athelia psychrophila]